ncbi:uncharacterized protein [Coffea arabica]|uniref:Acidic leucine-rich nuclear phosphoprotein 32 family member B-like n=1 Tax=Coffea arabica TaxID=13443 RepID=A0A6P6TQ31_COFAR|nr:acidic leucine-rich nuclear phosphoprotein 32 family member B-like [Coffea arabica]XP_027080573.1 acidic leucine-rich nuclear phosphoprotein 32 family member B-like [Coffea arabica]
MATFADPDNTLIRDEEIKSDKGSLPAKRNPELASLDEENIHEDTVDPNKKLKLGNDLSVENNDRSIGNDPLIPDVEENKDVNGTKNHSAHVEQVLENEDNEVEDQDGEDYEDEEEEGEEEEDEDGEEDSDDDDSDANAEIVDRKGKGIMRDDKGKGKLVEVSRDSSDSGSESDAESDLSDDPLAEIDLDNILPSRTRRRVVQPGVHISNDQGAKEDEDDSD